MNIIQRIKRLKALFVDVAEDIRYRMCFGAECPQSTLSLKDRIKALSADFAIIMCIVAVVVLCIVGVVRSYCGYAYGLHKHKIDDFDKYESHFELIANEVYEYYTANHEYNQNCVCLYVYPVNGEFHVYYVYDDATPVRMLAFDMSEAEEESFDAVDALFADASSDGMFKIAVSSDQVSFCKTSEYALVYRFDGEAPTQIDPDLPTEVFSVKITDGWYHSVKIPQEQ